MARPAVDEALAVLRERFPDGAPPLEDEDAPRAWAGGLRGVADVHVLEAAGSWPGPAFPKLTEFLVHLSEVSNSSPPPAPPQRPQGQLSGLSRKEQSRAKLAAIRAQFEAEAGSPARRAARGEVLV